MLAARVVFAIVACAIVGVIAVSYLKSWRGRPVRGTLTVPQGKHRMSVSMCDDTPLRPFKYGQVFEVTLSPAETSITDAATGETRTGTGSLQYRGKALGFADADSSYTHVLLQLADRYPKVVVPMVVSSLDAQGKPVVELLLPGPDWFTRAVKASKQEA